MPWIILDDFSICQTILCDQHYIITPAFETGPVFLAVCTAILDVLALSACHHFFVFDFLFAIIANAYFRPSDPLLVLFLPSKCSYFGCGRILLFPSHCPATSPSILNCNHIARKAWFTTRRQNHCHKQDSLRYNSSFNLVAIRVVK